MCAEYRIYNVGFTKQTVSTNEQVILEVDIISWDWIKKNVTSWNSLKNRFSKWGDLIGNPTY